MKYRLADLCYFSNKKISVSELTCENYVSTENMLSERGGLAKAASLPTVEYTLRYDAGDILVSNIRPYFKKIWQAKTHGGCSNDVLVVKAKDGVDKTYLYYVLADDRFFEYATRTAKGTKMPRGDKKAILEYTVEGHTIEEEAKIGSILRVIDEKIENNKAINDNLAA